MDCSKRRSELHATLKWTHKELAKSSDFRQTFRSITIDSPDKVIYVPKAIVENCDRVQAKNWVYCVFRKTLAVAGVWAIGVELFPSIVPNAEQVIQLAAREAPKILATVDLTFSQKPIPSQKYTLLFQDTTLNGKWKQGMDLVIPTTGVTSSTLSVMRDLGRI